MSSSGSSNSLFQIFYNQGWPSLHLKFFSSIDLLKKLIALWRFYINITVCVGITVHWSETFFIIFHKENSVFVNIFEHFWSILSHLLDFSVKAFTFGIDCTIQWRLISLGVTLPVEFERNFQYGLILFCYSYTFCWVFLPVGGFI